MSNPKKSNYASVEKPWLKYYSEQAKTVDMPKVSIYEYLWQNNKDFPEDIAIIFAETKITYGEMFENIEKAAKAFYGEGVRSGDTVSIIAITTPEILYSMYALSKIGAVCNMLDPRMPVDMLKEMMVNTNSKWLVILDIFNAISEQFAINDTFKIVEIKTPMGLSGESTNNGRILWEEFIIRNQHITYDMVTDKGELPVLIEYTGGTTGKPKGVLLSNNNINAVAAQYSVNGIPLKRKDVCQCVAAPFIAYVITLGTHVPLSHGITCKIAIYEPELIVDDIINNEYNHIAANPTVWEKLINSPKAQNKDFSKLIMPISGADAMSLSLQNRINEFLKEHNCPNVVCNGYGMTESGIAGCVNLSKEISKPESVGIPFVKTIITAFDEETNEELPYNNIGELCISGPCVMMCYVNNKEATDNMLRIHSDGRQWLHTGDYGYIDEDGFVFVIGRMKRMIIRDNGAKVFPMEVEKIVNEIPGIIKCALIGKDDIHSAGKVPVLFVVKDKETCDEEMKVLIRNTCLKNLLDYSIPQEIIFKDDLPITPIGKVDYRLLENEANSQ